MSSRGKGKPIKSGDRSTVLNVYEYFRKCYPNESVSFIVEKTSEATATSKRSIYRIKKEEINGNVRTPRKIRKKVIYSNSRAIKFGGFVISAIRRIVHSFFAKNRPPTLNAVLSKVNEDPNLPDFKRTTLWQLLKDAGFCFERRNKKSLLLEREDIIVWRHSYLRQIRDYRRQKKCIIYLDETWVNVGHKVNKVWVDKTIKTPKDAYMAGLTTGLKDPTERGPRFVITHAGGENGFVKEAKMVFLAKKGKEDYHDEMDGPRFEKWFKEQLIPNLPPNALIVMDNAPYHSVKVEKVPTTKSRKEDIKNWLREKNINFHDDSLKKELLNEVGKVKHLYSAYVIDELAKKHGLPILRLPPYHCELNPIEFVWSQVKRHVAMHNTEYKKDLIGVLIDNAFNAVTNEQWKNYCKHVEDIEDTMWKADDLQDDIEPFIIQLKASSDEEEFSSSDSTTSEMSGVNLLD